MTAQVTRFRSGNRSQDAEGFVVGSNAQNHTLIGVGSIRPQTAQNVLERSRGDHTSHPDAHGALDGVPVPQDVGRSIQSVLVGSTKAARHRNGLGRSGRAAGTGNAPSGIGMHDIENTIVVFTHRNTRNHPTTPHRMEAGDDIGDERIRSGGRESMGRCVTHVEPPGFVTCKEDRRLRRIRRH
jgi:hypothetical protein